MISKKNHRVRKQSETLYIAALRERKRTSPTTDDLVERPLAIEEAVALFHPPVGGYMLVRRVWWRALHGRRPRFEYFKPLKQIKIKQGRKEARISSEVPPEISRFQGKASVDQLVESDLSTPPACRPSASTPASGRSRSRNVIKNELFNFWLSFCGLYLVDAGSRRLSFRPGGWPNCGSKSRTGSWLGHAEVWLFAGQWIRCSSIPKRIANGSGCQRDPSTRFNFQNI